MGTFIRKHTPGQSGVSGTTVAGTIAALVAPGNTLVAVLTNNASHSVSSLTVPVGESASWVRVSSTHVGTTVVRLEVWAIKTTVTWTVSTPVTATFSGAATGTAISLAEFNSVSLTVIATDHQGGTATSKTVGATGLSAGDLAIWAGVVNGGTIRITQGSQSLPAGTYIGFDAQRPGYPSFPRCENNVGMLIPNVDGDMSVRFDALFDGSNSPAPTAMDAVLVVLQSDNYPPNAPLTSMASGGTINRASSNRARWTFSDDNPSDSQSAFRLFYRLVGDTSWTTVYSAVPTQFYDFAAGTLAAGDWEWQVETYDSLGALGARSASGFFTAADQPDGPTVTYPVAGQAVEQHEHVDWSSPDQEKYQIRRVADDAGDPDPGTIYFDTGEVADATTRTLSLNFSVNDRIEHVQVRVYADGLWSDWVDVDVDVSYTPPPTPSYLLYPDPSDGSLLLVITNPAPSGDEPAAIYNRVLIDDSSEGLRVDRNGVGISPNSTWRYRVPVSGYSYTPDRLIVEAVADNGTTARSAT